MAPQRADRDTMMPRSRPPVRRAALAVLPAAVSVAFVLGVGLGSMVLQSLGLLPLFGHPQLNLEAYDQGRDLLAATTLSLLIAVLSTALAALVGLATALLLAHRIRGRGVLAALAAAAIPVPHLVGAASIGLLLSDGGLLPRWFDVPSHAWPAAVGGQWPVAVVAEYAWKESAFVALVVSATLARRAPELLQTAALLGAGPGARFRHVTLPLTAPALIASSAIAFLYTLGSYEVAWLLGASYPEALPVMSYRLYTSIDLGARPEAMAVAVLTTALAAFVVVPTVWLFRGRTAGWR
jgi:putative spermidine/putrescine transport system permease protein